MNRLLPPGSLLRRPGGLLRRLSTDTEAAPSPSLPSVHPQADSLYHRIAAVAIPHLPLAPVLEQWTLVEGRPVEKYDLQSIIKNLMRLHRYSHALELSFWMTDRRHHRLSPGDVAYRLELLNKVHGLESAVEYFGGVSKHLKKSQCYGSLLKCYTEAKSITEAEGLFGEIREMGMMNSYAYNVMMKLYWEIGQVEKVHTMYRDMEESGIKPDLFTVDILLTVYADAEDIKGIDEVLRKADQCENIMTWHAYSIVFRAFMKAGLQERAMQALQESEKRINPKNGRVAYGSLLSICADFGMHSEVDRIWDVYKSEVPACNSMYMCRISVLLKMNDIAGAEKAFREWESRHVHHDFRLTNLLINGYCSEGLMEKAEALVDEAITKGRTPYANTWYKLAGGFFKVGNVSKAVDLTRKALTSATSGWKPNLKNVLMSLDYYMEQKNVEAAEEMASLLGCLIPLSRDVYHSLLKIYVCAGKPVSELLDRMKKDGLEADEETDKILAGMGQ